MNRLPINYELVNSQDQLDKLQTFMASFDHEAYNPINGTVIIVKRGEQWIGVAQIALTPLFVTAWKPSESSARDAKEGLDGLTHWAKMQACLQGKTAIGYALTDEDSPFTQEVMNKLGFDKCNCIMYKPRV